MAQNRDASDQLNRSRAQASTLKGVSLPFWTKLFYGAGDTGFSLAYTALDAYLLFFLLTVVKLPAAYAAAAIFFGRTWDWINDPLVGVLSDHTRSRWGRRRPYLLLGPIPFGLSFLLLWWIPPINSPLLLTAYYGFAYFLFDGLATLVSVPYLALIPELTPDYDERTSINTYRMFFSIAAGILGFAMPDLVQLFPDPETGYIIVAAMFALVSAVPLWGVFAVAREKPEYALRAAEHSSLEGNLLRRGIEWLKGRTTLVLASAAYLILWTIAFYVLPRTLGSTEGGASWTDFVFYAGFLLPMTLITLRAFRRNRPFLIAMGIFLLTWTTIAVVQAVLPFYVTFWLNMEDRITEIMATVFISALLWLPLWNWFSKRFSKRLAYIVGMISMIVVLMIMAFLPSSASIGVVMLLSFLAGIGVSTAHVIPNAIIPDSIEWDELRTGLRREGVYYSMITLMNKVASSVAVPWAALVLALSGFNEALGLSQPETALTAIRMLVGLVPGLLMLLGIFLAGSYPLNRERHARIRRLLSKRRLARTSGS